ncbi:hypothetical protein [Roseateles sp.]|uniref:hypothetical protein n=1 Tax=Roseateles sp. TaxID=1971397 RepID=UPI003BA3FFB4
MNSRSDEALPADAGQLGRGVGRPVPKRANLPSDISRCEGDNGASQGAKCRDCARREQLKHDDPTRWFSVMFVRPQPDGSCPYWIREVYA